MTEIKRHKGGITIKGHAKYAPIGQDIVCAGVSTLAQTLIASIEELTGDEIQVDMQPGSVEIKYGTLSAEAQLLIESFFIGANLIAGEFPENVRIV